MEFTPRGFSAISYSWVTHSIITLWTRLRASARLRSRLFGLRFTVFLKNERYRLHSIQNWKLLSFNSGVKNEHFICALSKRQNIPKSIQMNMYVNYLSLWLLITVSARTALSTSSRDVARSLPGWEPGKPSETSAVLEHGTRVSSAGATLRIALPSSLPTLRHWTKTPAMRLWGHVAASQKTHDLILD